MNIHRGCVYIFIYLILLCGNISTFSATIDVPADRPTIQSGIDAAKDGDTVLVADGIYRGEGNVNIDFRGKRITVKSQNGAKATIIDCGRKAETRGFTFQNKETNDSVLDGFTIRNGVHELGGGIYCNNASPTIKNCVIAWNTAAKNDRGTGRGGGIYCFNSDAKIIDSTISNNSAESAYGGGVYFDGNTIIDDVILRETSFKPSLLNCTISDNTGSGVYIQSDARAEIRDSKILHNSWRGIICTFFSRGGSLITNCEIAQNTGGGVEVSEYSILKITDSIIRQNTAKSGGGISCSPSANVVVSECIIDQNIATRWGGGIGVSGLKWGNVEINRCTITRNSASERGGGVYAFIEGSRFTLSDSIVWGNSSNTTHHEFSGIGGKIVITSCDIRDGLDGIDREPDEWFIYEDNIDEDPLFVDADRGNYRLKENSPAAAMGAHSIFETLTSVSSIGKQLAMWGELKRN
ncbi:hypothetical protein C6501_13825 [Candidatus Poribacteria bacterium]|nr:MAG: hypothetical protein C6501_13825 [Candidatus Poribacteria bacterium]